MKQNNNNNNSNKTDIVQISIVHDYAPTGLHDYHMVSNGKQLGNKRLLPDEMAALVVVLMHALRVTYKEMNEMLQSAGQAPISLKEYLEGLVASYLADREGANAPL